MKTKSTLLIVASLLMLSACQNPAENLAYYDFETAKITYEISGSSNGSSEALIKGNNKKIENSFEVTDAPEQEQNTMFLQKGFELYNINLNNNTGVVTQNPTLQKISEMSAQQQKEYLIAEAVSGGEVPYQDLQEITTKTVAGKECTEYQYQNTTTCIWQTIPIETRFEIADKGINVYTVATSIETGIQIDDSEFEPPENINFMDLTEGNNN